MNIAILTSLLYQSVAEINGEDRIIYGGAENYAVQLCYLIQSLGHTVTLYQSLPQTTTDEQGRKVKINSGNIVKNFRGIPVVCLADTEEGWSMSTNPKLNMVFNEIAV